MQHFSPLIFSTVTWNLNADHVPQLLKTNTPERLSEDISQLLLCLRVTEDNPALINTLPDEMVKNINVLAPVVEDGVPAKSYGRLVVHQELWRAKLPPFISAIPDKPRQMQRYTPIHTKIRPQPFAWTTTR